MRRGRSKRRESAAAAAKRKREEVDAGMEDEAVGEVTIEELREFLEADLVQVPVDPEFRERLRDRLWDLVKSRSQKPRN